MSRPVLSARRLAVTRNGHPLLAPTDLDLHPGEVLGIIGPNGAGKSTLLRALAAVEPRRRTGTTGAIATPDGDLARMSARRRARHVAFVAQETGVPVDISVADLVRLGRYATRTLLGRPDSGEAPGGSGHSVPEQSDAVIVAEALDRVGLTGFAERRVPELSGGERQLAQVARALAQRSSALLLDEPTSALDAHHRMRLFALLRQCATAGQGVAVVLHDLNDAARACDRLAVIHEGHLDSLGTPETVLTPALLARVHRIRAYVHPDPDGNPHVHALAAITTP